jgi:hypothetical protein
MKSERIEHGCRDIGQTHQAIDDEKSTAGIQKVFSISGLPNDIYTPELSGLLETQIKASFVSFFARSRPNRMHTN